jgi:hypothetical protein
MVGRVGGLVVAWLALQEAPPPADRPAPAEWDVRAAAPGAGSKWQLSSSVEHRLAVEFRVRGAKLRDFEQTIRDDAAWVVEVVADDAGALAATASYGECSTELATPLADKKEKADFAGKRFEVAGGDNAARVRELDLPEGTFGYVATDLAGRIAHDAREALHGGWFAQLLAEKPLVEGRAIEVPAELGTRLLGRPLQGGKLDSFRLVPRAARREDGRDVVVLDAAVTASLPPRDGALPAVTTTFELAGEVVVARDDGRIVVLSLAGPIRCTGRAEQGGSTIEVAGTGTLAWTYRAQLLPR